MIMKRRGRAAAHVIVVPIDTAQPCNPRSRCSEISFGVHVYIQEKTEGGMDPEPGELVKSSAGADGSARTIIGWYKSARIIIDRLVRTGQLKPSSAGTSQLESSSAGTSRLESSSADTDQLKLPSAGTDQLESPSAGTGFETSGQQYLPNWEMGRTTVDGCLLIGVSSNLGGNIFPSKSSLPVYLKTRSQPTKKISTSTPGGKEGSHWYSFLFLEMHGIGCPACLFCFCLPACFVSVSFCFLLQEKLNDHFSAS